MALIQQDWCSYKNGNLDSDLHTEKTLKTTGRGQPSLKRERGLEQQLLSGSSGGHNLSTPWFWYSTAGTTSPSISGLSHSVCDPSLPQPTEANTLSNRGFSQAKDQEGKFGFLRGIFWLWELLTLKNKSISSITSHAKVHRNPIIQIYSPENGTILKIFYSKKFKQSLWLGK